MKIGHIRHKRLRRFIDKDDASGLPAAFVEKIRSILSFLQDMENVTELQTVSSWKAHLLTGDLVESLGQSELAHDLSD